MKSSLAKVSLALVSVVFILGCQDVGTGPDGLVPQFAKVKDCDPSNPPVHRSCKDAPNVDRPQHTITLTIDGNASAAQPTNGDGSFNVAGFVMDASFFADKLSFTDGSPSCFLAAAENGGDLSALVGHLVILGFQPLTVYFTFPGSGDGAGAEHTLGLLEPSPETWPPTTDPDGDPNGNIDGILGEDPSLAVAPDPGEWMVTSKGKNHQNACTGTGSGSIDGVKWELTAVEVV